MRVLRTRFDWLGILLIPSPARNKVLPMAGWLDVTLILLLVLAGSWVVFEPAMQVALGVCGVGWLVISLTRSRCSLRDLGLRRDNVFSCLAAVFLPTLLMLTPIALTRPGEVSFPFLRELPSYAAWALFQQFLLVAAFWRHFRDWIGVETWLSWPNLVLSLLTGTVFAIVHTPNLGLMALTFAGESLWLLLFWRFRNLFVLAFAHATSALVVSHWLVPSALLPNMKVGAGFWNG